MTTPPFKELIERLTRAASAARSGYSELTSPNDIDLLDEAAQALRTLLDELARKDEALRQSAKQFRFYELHHRDEAEKIELGRDTVAKARRDKERVNREMAELCEAALTQGGRNG